jgi:hypothetical protein
MGEVSRPKSFERSDADPRLISGLALGVLLFLICVPVIVVVGFPAAGRLGRIPEDLPQPPSPRLQVTPKADLDRLRDDEDRELTTFGWVDRNRQITRIPIERAMKLLGERGIAGWPSTDKPSAHGTPQ